MYTPDVASFGTFGVKVKKRRPRELGRSRRSGTHRRNEPPVEPRPGGGEKTRVFDPVHPTRLVNRWTVPGQPHAGALPARVGSRNVDDLSRSSDDYNYDPHLHGDALGSPPPPFCAQSIYLPLVIIFSKKTSFFSIFSCFFHKIYKNI